VKGERDDRYLLGLDVGTGAVRCVLFDLCGRIVFRETRPRVYLQDPSGDVFLKTFDAPALWEDICGLTRSVFENTGVSARSVLAVSAACQRFSSVFLDGRGRDVYAGPNLDTRGVYTQASIERAMGDEYYRITGQWPPLLSALARLLWFRAERPAEFRRIRAVLTLNDWVLFQLSGERASEASAASGSGLLDVAAGTWSGRILDAFELDPALLPPLRAPGEAVGEVTAGAARESGLAPGTPVVVGGADTQCALLGAGLLSPGRYGIAAGTTGPACLTLDVPLVDAQRGLWTSCHMEPGAWILEANCQWLGSVYQWLHDILRDLPLAPAVRADLYGWMEAQAERVPPGAAGALAFLGPMLMNAREFHVIRPGAFLFPPPAHPMSAEPARMGHLIRSALENLAYALRGNVTLLRGSAGRKPERVCVTGGMARSGLFCRILADCLGVPVEVAAVREGSALGAAICAAAGGGAFGSVRDARAALTRLERAFEPDREAAEAHEEAYARWVEVYRNLQDLQAARNPETLPPLR